MAKQDADNAVTNLNATNFANDAAEPGLSHLKIVIGSRRAINSQSCRADAGYWKSVS